MFGTQARRFSALICLAGLAAFSCQEASPPSTPSPPLAGVKVHWELKGPAEFAPLLPAGQDDDVDEVEADSEADLGAVLGQASLEELARDLRPVMLFDGKEYQGSWEDALQMAAAVQAAWASRSRAPTSARPEGGTEFVQQKEVLGGVDSRASVQGTTALDRPYRYLGYMEPSQPNGGGRCTCIKMINHAACITAAHCVNTGVKPPKNKPPHVWNALPRVTFHRTGPAPMPTLDPAVHPYAIVIPAGWRTSRAFDYAVLRFRGEINGTDAQQSPLGVTSPAVPSMFFDLGPTEYARTTYLDVAVDGPSPQNIPGDFILAGFPGPSKPPPSCGGVQPCLASGTAAGVQFYRSKASRPYLHYAIDASGGMSGGALFLDRGAMFAQRFQVVAIHKGPGLPNVGTKPVTYKSNRGVLMTPAVDVWLTLAAGGEGTVFPN